MPCMSTPRTSKATGRAQTFEERALEVGQALRRLEAKLQAGQVKVGIAPNGAVTFVGWQDRDDVTDVCAYRSLSAQGSFALRQAVQRAEQTQGRKVNAQAVAQGYHSHDGGKTWGKH